MTNRFAGMARFPVLPVIAPKTRFQPVYVRDLAQAIAASALDPAAHGGKTYEIAGPQVMTMRELNAAIAKAAGQSPDLVDVPDFAADIMSRFGFLPGAPLTRDQWMMLQNDNVAAPKSHGLEGVRDRPDPAWRGRAPMARPLPPRRALRSCRQRRLKAHRYRHARPAARHHPRHRRGGHRISAGLLDRPSDPRHRIARLQGRRMGPVQHRHPARRDPRHRPAYTGAPSAT